jgi:anaerobic magnesium-protoporphyrin IX monomethyl ester cyclase
VQDTVKVALINPPIEGKGFRHQRLLPIGLGYLAAVLEKNSHEVKVIDCPVLGIDCSALKPLIQNFNPDVVGITSMTTTIDSAFAVAKAAKEEKPDAVVVIGGPHVTFMDEQILKDVLSIDVVVRGEGEQTIVDLAQKVADQKPLQDVAGITIRKGKEIVRTADRGFIENLDDLPFPSLKHFELEHYRVFGRRIFPVMSSRGCPFQCSFCITSRIFGKTTRMRSPENVVSELEWLKNNYGADSFTFFDDTFTLDKNRVNQICDQMIEKKIDIPWDCQTRVDQISPEILAKMKKAGCEMITFGIESGCQHILDKMGKKTSIEQNERGIKMIKKAGITVVTSVIVGFPGEDIEMTKQTLGFVQRLKPDNAFVCVATPYPGTELYRFVKEKGWDMSPDWKLYDTFNSVFHNPLVAGETLLELRKKFYDDFYSPSYAFRQLTKGNYYNRILARTALNHIVWRLRGAW